MKKRKNIIYWVSTGLLVLGLLYLEIVPLFWLSKRFYFPDLMRYQMNTMIINVLWQILGITILLIPKFPLLKEWAYAYFFVEMINIAIFRMVSSHDYTLIISPVVFILLIFVSWYTRPDERKIIKY